MRPKSLQNNMLSTFALMLLAIPAWAQETAATAAAEIPKVTERMTLMLMV